MRAVTPLHPWQGRARLHTGLALFVGRAGDNRAHAHLAHQLCLAAPGTRLRVQTDAGLWTGRACWIPGQTRHTLLALDGLLLWVDPTHTLATELPAATGLQPLPPAWRTRLEALVVEPDLRALAAAPAGGDVRLQAVLAYLHAGLAQAAPLRRAELARVAGLSPDRFTHWFSEQTGLPLRAYRKWLRLLAALQQVLAGAALVDAAHAAGFADQAHFARTLRETLGVSASVALRALA